MCGSFKTRISTHAMQRAFSYLLTTMSWNPKKSTRHRTKPYIMFLTMLHEITANCTSLFQELYYFHRHRAFVYAAKITIMLLYTTKNITFLL